MDTLENLTIIWIGVLLAHFMARATRLTPVLFYLFMGAVYVNTGLLPTEPGEFIRVFAEVGIILIMFALGFEESTDNFMTGVKRSWGIAFFGGVAPFLSAYLLALYFWEDSNMALVVGLSMAATAVSLTLMSLKSEGLNKTRAATGIMTSALLDDIASLALVAVIIPIASGQAAVGIMSVGLILGKAIVFFVVVAILSLWVLPTESKGPLYFVPGLGRFGIGHIFAFTRGQRTLVILIFVMLVAISSHALGLHPAVGAYMAGLILREEYFKKAPTAIAGVEDDDEAPEDFKSIKRLIDNVAFVWIGPVFFVALGAKIIFDMDLLISVVPYVALLTLTLITVQILSAGLAARYTGGFNFQESIMIGLGMLGRAELAFVVMDIAYVQNDILSEAAFYTLMVTAFFMNVSVPVGIRLWKPYFVKSLEKE
ncbi:MAG: cation:proton antiporter [Kordiimonadaceae bacterium]|jgi:Kef-type K+ transport system membrane component KefB|nr:cation:proton antiporter [Kordiimonadaceae bacterium]MBT6032429.1 cation:proton antiporter [Kordiimonadaceae bacterium]